ncbi:hypothetical protein AUO94_00500 [Planococcus kocurii]|uniref:Uncharacterized protein n=1 Tax=Planococcus kocurii TaxID=1374 RepID=A0ABM5WSB9_9BACL|nr:hypothetical protein [Planococcus kocurii]ALS77213.1 hypothetical protein AUO94_00500 [Planococcus kocurii]
MNRLKTLEAIKKDIEELQAYVNLVENYPTETLENRIIKTYACTNSLAKVLADVNAQLEKNESPLVDHSFITNFIKSPPIDKLHRLVRTNYLSKTKHNHKKINSI